MNFYGLHLNTRILVIFLIYVLYPPSLALRNLVLLLCCFALLHDLLLLVYYFMHLCLIEYGYHAQSLNFLVILVQRVLYCEYLSMSYINQSFYRFKCLEYLEHLKHLKYLKHLEHPKYSKRFEYLEYF